MARDVMNDALKNVSKMNSTDEDQKDKNLTNAEEFKLTLEVETRLKKFIKES